MIAAVDQDVRCERVYAASFGHPWRRKNVLGLRPSALDLGADLWWMSPPCQPYTVRGARRDLDDPRAKSLVHVLGLVEAVRPPRLAIENVPGFAGSRAHALVLSTLERTGYAVAERLICPTELGVPGVRLRWYLAASRVAPPRLEAPARPRLTPLASFLDAADDPSLVVPDDREARFAHAMHVVDRDDPEAVAACFTSAYARSPVYAGSYLRSRGRLRHFHPREIARLLGFPPSLDLVDLSRREAWDLVGNSLSVDAVRHVVDALRD